MSWLNHKFDLTWRSFLLYSTLKWLSETKCSLEWQKKEVLTRINVIKFNIIWSIKHKRFDTKNLYFNNTYLLKVIFKETGTGTNTHSIQHYCWVRAYMHLLKLNKKELKTSKKMLLLFFVTNFKQKCFCWKLLCFGITYTQLILSCTLFYTGIIYS